MSEIRSIDRLIHTVLLLAAGMAEQFLRVTKTRDLGGNSKKCRWKKRKPFKNLLELDD